MVQLTAFLDAWSKLEPVMIPQLVVPFVGTTNNERAVESNSCGPGTKCGASLAFGCKSFGFTS